MKKNKVHPFVIVATFSVLAFVLAWVTFVLAQPTLNLLRNGTRAEATIVEVAEVHRTDFDGFSPVVIFADKDGTEHRIQCNFASGQPTWKVGDKLKIIYPPNQPQEACTTHWFDLWGLVFFPLFASVLSMVIAISSLFRFLWSRARKNERVD